MKSIRSKKQVLVDAQTVRKGIIVVRLEEFKFLGSVSKVNVAYYEQIENTEAQVGEPRYNLIPTPVKSSITGKPHVKQVTLPKPLMDGLFAAVDQSVLKSGSFTEQLDEVLTKATLIQIVQDGNYNAIEGSTLSPLTVEDWEIVNAQELVA